MAVGASPSASLAFSPLLLAELLLTLGDWMINKERDYIQRAPEANDWHGQDTAKLLCISRKTLWDKLKRLEIQRADSTLAVRTVATPDAVA